MLRIALAFAFFAIFVFDRQWAYCWYKDHVIDHARNQWLCVAGSIGLVVTSVVSSGAEHKNQNYGKHQSRSWCFYRRTASVGDLVMLRVPINEIMEIPYIGVVTKDAI